MNAHNIKFYFVGMLLLGGCATVDPQADYERAVVHIEQSTGFEDVYIPGDEQLAQSKVSELLADELTSEEAARIALLNHPRLQSSFYEVGIARADVVQSGLWSNPSLGFAFRLPSGGGLANFEADLAQNIVDLWQIPVRKRAAERTLEQAILHVADEASRIVSEAKSAYFAALGADQRLEIARENHLIAQRILELAELRKRAGAGSDLETNLARGVVMEAELSLKESRFAAAQARRSLSRALGIIEDPAELVLSDEFPDTPQDGLDVTLLVDQALAQRPDVRAMYAAVGAAQEKVVLEYRRIFPSLSVGLALERGERGPSEDLDLAADTARSSLTEGRLTPPEITPRSERKRHTDLIIGPSFSLELPVFDQNQAQIARAQLLLQQSLLALDGLEREIHQNIRGAVDQAQTAWEVARFYQDQVVPQARRNLEMSRDAYEAGKTSILAVLDAERTYLTTRNQFAGALEQAGAAIPELERAVGLPFEKIVALCAGTLGQQPDSKAAGEQQEGNE